MFLGCTGEEMTGHGFRTIASTLLNEDGTWRADAIERQLSHQEDDEVRGAYKLRSASSAAQAPERSWLSFGHDLSVGGQE